MADRLPPDRYRELVERVLDCVRLHVPLGAVVLVASKGDEALVRLPGYRAWHFPQTASGVYAGHHPANSAAAVAHLQRLVLRGAQYLVVPSSARWWLEYYAEFAAYLENVHTLAVSDDDTCAIFALDQSAIAQTARDLDDAEPQGHDRVDHAVPLIAVARPAPKRPERILTILARFGTDDYPHAERQIADIFCSQLPEVTRTVVVVDNALPSDVVREAPDGFLLGGDNAAREFSAFDRAIDFIGSGIWGYDLVHFATSAFNTLYVSYLRRFTGTVFAAVAGRPVCLGHIDCYNKPVDVLTYRSQHWMRSCFFFLPPAEVKALGTFVSLKDGTDLFSGSAAAPFRADAPLCERYRRYVTDWLAGADIGQGVEWHSSFDLTPATVPTFERKALSILNEHLLSIRLRALGCHLVDVTWLSTMLRGRNILEIPWPTDWREQLATRDNDAVVISGAPVAQTLSTV
jgi:hypothetical protein